MQLDLVQSEFNSYLSTRVCMQKGSFNPQVRDENSLASSGEKSLLFDMKSARKNLPKDLFKLSFASPLGIWTLI